MENKLVNLEGANPPLLPGYVPTNLAPLRDFHPKRQMFIVKGGIPILTDEPKPIGRSNPGELGISHPLNPPLHLGDLQTLQRDAFQLQMDCSRRPHQSMITNLFVPKWVEAEKKILRFTGYFKEYLTKSKDMEGDMLALSPTGGSLVSLGAWDEYCIRTVVLRYFMIDNSMELLEPRVANSGLQQGRLIGRQHIAKPDRPEVNYHFTDLNLGKTVDLYGRRVTLTDCDERTKDLLQSEGIEVGEPVPIPADPYLVKRASLANTPTRQSDLKDVLGIREAGGRRRGQSDRYLRFTGLLQDSSAEGSGRDNVIRAAILYDLNKEMVEIRKLDSSSEGPSVLLKWCKVPLDENIDKSSIGEDHSLPYLTCLQLVPSSSLSIFGRKLLVTGCDDFTRNYLNDLQSVTIPKDSNLVPEITDEGKVEKVPEVQIEEEIQAEGVSHLAVPIDQSKWMRNERTVSSAGRPRTDIVMRSSPKSGLLPPDQNTILRFLAVLNSRNNVDESREFIISYFLADDTMQLVEKKSVGGFGGRSVSRGKIPNPNREGDSYWLSDLQIGNRLEIYGRFFTIMGCDRRLLGFIEARPDEVSPQFSDSIKKYFGIVKTNDEERE